MDAYCRRRRVQTTASAADLLTAQIYDPILNKWTVLFSTGPRNRLAQDRRCSLLRSARLAGCFLGSIGTTATAIYDPVANTWTAGGSKDDHSEEETWTLLPDETFSPSNAQHWQG